MAGLFFVTASEADFKIVNHALLCMRDWEESDGALDNFKLVTDKTAFQNDNNGTSLLWKSLLENAWNGAKLKDVEAYCMDLRQSDDEQKGANLFVVLDSVGIEDKTCILASLPDEYHENPGAFRGRYDKVRVPWGDLYSIWSNLDIANMNFEEFVEEEEGDQQGWFTYQSIFGDDNDDVRKAGLKKRNKKIDHWRQQEYI
jgi:hypothetical protein